MHSPGLFDLIQATRNFQTTSLLLVMTLLNVTLLVMTTEQAMTLLVMALLNAIATLATIALLAVTTLLMMAAEQTQTLLEVTLLVMPLHSAITLLARPALLAMVALLAVTALLTMAVFLAMAIFLVAVAHAREAIQQLKRLSLRSAKQRERSHDRKNHGNRTQLHREGSSSEKGERNQPQVMSPLRSRWTDSPATPLVSVSGPATCVLSSEVVFGATFASHLLISLNLQINPICYLEFEQLERFVVDMRDTIWDLARRSVLPVRRVIGNLSGKIAIGRSGAVPIPLPSCGSTDVDRPNLGQARR